jgi:antitoxin VapB
MALSIKDPDCDRLARELAAQTGETMTQAIKRSLEERLARTEKAADTERDRYVADLLAIGQQIAALPELDPRPIDEILYDEDGQPR